MSDTPPPPPPPPVPPVPPIPPSGAGDPSAPDPSPEVPATDELSLWVRYRALPTWAQVLIPVVIVALLIGLIVLLTSGDSDDTAPADTTVAGESNMDEVLRGIIVIGGIRGGETTATTVVDTTESVTTEPATTAVPETTEPAVAPESTSTTAVSTTTAQSATTTAAPTETTEPVPTTSNPDSPGLPSPADFISQWNDATARTDVPEITQDQISEIVDGPFAGAFLVTLTPDVDDPEAPQVGLIGTMSTSDPSQIAELLLVYVNGPDESASDFYWEAFGVLTLAVDPATTDDQLAELESTLGRADGLPPFPDGTDNVATSNGFTFNLYTGETQEGTPATGIAVT